MKIVYFILLILFVSTNFSYSEESIDTSDFKEGYVYKYKIIEDYSTDNTEIEYEGNFKVDNISQYQNEKRIMSNYENRDIRNHIYKYKIGNNIYTEKCDTGYIYKYKNGKSILSKNLRKDAITALLEGDEKYRGDKHLEDYFGIVEGNELKPSFNCNAKNLTPLEKKICSEGDISRADRIYNGYYKYVYNKLDNEDKKELKKIADDILSKRNYCWMKTPTGEYDVVDIDEYDYNFHSRMDASPLSDCFDTIYNEGFTRITDFLMKHENGKNKHILENMYKNSPIKMIYAKDGYSLNIKSYMFIRKTDKTPKHYEEIYEFLSCGFTPHAMKVMLASGVVDIYGNFLVK